MENLFVIPENQLNEYNRNVFNYFTEIVTDYSEDFETFTDNFKILFLEYDNNADKKIKYEDYLTFFYNYCELLTDNVVGHYQKNIPEKFSNFYSNVYTFLKGEILAVTISKNEQNHEETKRSKPRTSDVNFKYALLQEMDVIKWVQTNIHTNNRDRAEILQEIIGGSIATLEDYLKGKTIVNKDVRQKALDLLNGKRFAH